MTTAARKEKKEKNKNKRRVEFAELAATQVEDQEARWEKLATLIESGNFDALAELGATESETGQCIELCHARRLRCELEQVAMGDDDDASSEDVSDCQHST